MAYYAEMKVAVNGHTDLAARCVFYEDEPEEKEIWVPRKCLEDPMAVDPENLDDDGNANISVAKWFLKENEIEYDSDSRDPDEPVRRGSSRR